MTEQKSSSRKFSQDLCTEPLLQLSRKKKNKSSVHPANEGDKPAGVGRPPLFWGQCVPDAGALSWRRGNTAVVDGQYRVDHRDFQQRHRRTSPQTNEFPQPQRVELLDHCRNARRNGLRSCCRPPRLLKQNCPFLST